MPLTGSLSNSAKDVGGRCSNLPFVIGKGTALLRSGATPDPVLTLNQRRFFCVSSKLGTYGFLGGKGAGFGFGSILASTSRTGLSAGARG